MVMVARYAECALNGFEYLLDENNNPMTFETVEQARQYLRNHGLTENEIQQIVFIREILYVKEGDTNEKKHLETN